MVTFPQLESWIRAGDGISVTAVLLDLGEPARRAMAAQVKGLRLMWNDPELSDSSLRSYDAHTRRMIHSQRREGALRVAGAACLPRAADIVTWLRSDRFWYQPLPETLDDLVEVLRMPGRPSLPAIARGLADRMRPAQADLHWPMIERLLAEAGLPAPATEATLRGWMRRVGADRYRQDLAELLRADPHLESMLPHVFTIPRLGQELDEEWTKALAKLAADGVLDRGALLDGCVLRLHTGDQTGPLRRMVVLHRLLAPTADEFAARRGEYTGMLAGPDSTVADLALRGLRLADDAGLLDLDTVAEAAWAVLPRKEKKLVRAQLDWLGAALTRKPDPLLFEALLTGLSHPAADLAERALKLAGKHLPAFGDSGLEMLTSAAATLQGDVGRQATALLAAAGSSDLPDDLFPLPALKPTGTSPDGPSSLLALQPTAPSPTGPSFLPTAPSSNGSSSLPAAERTGPSLNGSSSLPAAEPTAPSLNRPSSLPSPRPTEPSADEPLPLAALSGPSAALSGGVADQLAVAGATAGFSELPPAPVAAPMPDPIASIPELAAEAKHYLLQAEDPIRLELILDGLVRFAATDRPALAKALESFLPQWQSPFANLLRAVVTREAIKWTPAAWERRAGPPFWMTVRRMEELAAQMCTTPPPALLSTPATVDGHVDPARVLRLLSEGWEPQPHDLSQAMLRLPRAIAPEIRAAAAALAFPTQGPTPKVGLAATAGLATADHAATTHSTTTNHVGTGPVSGSGLADSAGLTAVRIFADFLASGGLPDPAVVTLDPTRPCHHRPKEYCRCASRTRRRVVAFDSIKNDLTVQPYLLFQPAEFAADRADAYSWDRMAGWPLMFPSHREIAAAHMQPRLIKATEGKGATSDITALPTLAACDGPFGPAMALCLAYGLSAGRPEGRLATGDAFVDLAARGILDGTLIGRELAVLHKSNVLTLKRMADTFTQILQAGAATEVWAVLREYLPTVLSDPKPPVGTPDLLLIAESAAAAANAHDDIPELTALATRTTRNRVTTESARLHRTLINNRP